jgi:hypothetical protein
MKLSVPSHPSCPVVYPEHGDEAAKTTSEVLAAHQNAQLTAEPEIEAPPGKC